jgi:hypothetical protein
MGPIGPGGAAGPAGPGGPAGGVTMEQLNETLNETLNEALNASMRPIADHLKLVEAKLSNIRLRSRNKRLQPHQQWVPLQREEPVGGGAAGPAPGALPPEGLIPERGLSDAHVSQANLQALALFYRVVFASWEEFFDYLKY